MISHDSWNNNENSHEDEDEMIGRPNWDKRDSEEDNDESEAEKEKAVPDLKQASSSTFGPAVHSEEDDEGNEDDLDAVFGPESGFEGSRENSSLDDNRLEGSNASASSQDEKEIHNADNGYVSDDHMLSSRNETQHVISSEEKEEDDDDGMPFGIDVESMIPASREEELRTADDYSSYDYITPVDEDAEDDVAGVSAEPAGTADEVAYHQDDEDEELDDREVIVHDADVGAHNGNPESSNENQYKTPGVEIDDNAVIENADWYDEVDLVAKRWEVISERFGSKEAFKTGFVLPILSALGYEAFNPSEVEPLESNGEHTGYIVNGPRGLLMVSINDEVHDDSINMIIDRDRVIINVGSTEEDSDVKLLVEMSISGEGSLKDLEYLHKDVFNPAKIHWLVNQVHGNQEHILEAMRSAILLAHPGFVEDVRSLLADQGHYEIPSLGERMALLAPKLFASENEGDAESGEGKTPSPESEDDEKTRVITPAEQQAYETIRDICGPQIDPDRIFARPAKTYLAVLLDDNNRKTIARLHFSGASKKYIGIFTGKEETKQLLASTAEISNWESQLKARAEELDPEAFA